jgi:hypothetical protein
MSGEFVVRTMEEADLPAVLAIDGAVGWAHDEGRFRFLLADAESRGLVAVADGVLAGFARPSGATWRSSKP